MGWILTRRKALVLGILLSALGIGSLLGALQGPLAVSQPLTISIGGISGSIPMDASNPVWESVQGFIIPLSGQTITTPMHPNISIKTIVVKMATNGKEIGLWAVWRDKTMNNTVSGPQDFMDQVAVQFPVQTTGAPPFQCMGQSGGTVNIWRWNAEGQNDLVRGVTDMWDVDNQYPSIAWDYYYEEPAGGVTYQDRIGRSLGPFNPGIWPGNIMSDPNMRVSSVEDLEANGFSTLSTQASQDVVGNGLWEKSNSFSSGRGSTWRVVMKRSLTTNDPNDVQFQTDSSIPVAFAIWDGSNVERNGMKSISTWVTARMPSGGGITPYAGGPLGGGNTCTCKCQNQNRTCEINCCPQ